MRLEPRFMVVIGIVAAFGLYFVVSAVVGGHGHAAKAAASADTVPTVQVAMIQPQMRPDTVSMRGRTQAARTVSVRSETAGVVSLTPVREGSFVKTGEVLCKLKVDARQATLDQAQANLRSKELTQKASAELAARGFRSPTQLLADQANLDQASASVRQAEVALNQTDIRAPYAGVFNERDIEVGGYLAAGGACGVVMELDPLKIAGDVPETEIGKVRLGAPAHVTLASGEKIEAVVYYIAKDADPQTRTYPVVLVAHNPGSVVRSGLSAEVRIDAGQVDAHLAPASSLVLDSAGRQGLRYIGPSGLVAFAPVKVLDETPSGVWVAGLSGPVRVITVGQAYVSEGQRVHLAGG
jgi:multidrug efflux system membrane fusion protein